MAKPRFLFKELNYQMTAGVSAENPATASLELAVIVPTFNERENVMPLLDALAEPLKSIEHEVVFVDDNSPDGTAQVVAGIALANPRVRVLQRKCQRGLASACIAGMRATSARYIAVMDADLQHDERILPAMLAKMESEQLDLVVGTRNSSGGGMGEFSKARVLLSHSGKLLSGLLSNTGLSDPMSGFFIVDRRFLDEVGPSLSGIGFKILLELIAAADRPVRLAEVPYTFRKRLHGTSKLTAFVGLEYLRFVFNNVARKWRSRFSRTQACHHVER